MASENLTQQQPDLDDQPLLNQARHNTLGQTDFGTLLAKSMGETLMVSLEEFNETLRPLIVFEKKGAEESKTLLNYMLAGVFTLFDGKVRLDQNAYVNNHVLPVIKLGKIQSDQFGLGFGQREFLTLLGHDLGEEAVSKDLRAEPDLILKINEHYNGATQVTPEIIAQFLPHLPSFGDFFVQLNEYSVSAGFPDGLLVRDIASLTKMPWQFFIQSSFQNSDSAILEQNARFMRDALSYHILEGLPGSIQDIKLVDRNQNMMSDLARLTNGGAIPIDSYHWIDRYCNNTETLLNYLGDANPGLVDYTTWLNQKIRRLIPNDLKLQ